MLIDTQEVKEIVNGVRREDKSKSAWVKLAVSIVCQAIIERIEIFEEKEMMNIALNERR